jgi:hypothetical protein
MNKKELKESLHFWRVQVKDLPRKKKKVYTKAIDKMCKDLTKNNLHLKLSRLYPTYPINY